jgi:hypothetical protein
MDSPSLTEACLFSDGLTTQSDTNARISGGRAVMGLNEFFARNRISAMWAWSCSISPSCDSFFALALKKLGFESVPSPQVFDEPTSSVLKQKLLMQLNVTTGPNKTYTSACLCRARRWISKCDLGRNPQHSLRETRRFGWSSITSLLSTGCIEVSLGNLAIAHHAVPAI